MLDAKLKEAPESVEENLCLDAGYVGDDHRKTIEKKGYTPHIRSRGEEKSEKEKDPKYKPKRWIVEVAHSWFNRFRKILVRFEKKKENYLALLQLAASIICFRKIGKGEIIWG
jgi:transposase